MGGVSRLDSRSGNEEGERGFSGILLTTGHMHEKARHSSSLTSVHQRSLTLTKGRLPGVERSCNGRHSDGPPSSMHASSPTAISPLSPATASWMDDIEDVPGHLYGGN